MSKTYVAVQRTGQNKNELQHWKYIKKEKKNGKWRYFYDYKLTGKGYEEDERELRRRAENMLAYARARVNKDLTNQKAWEDYYKVLDKYYEMTGRAIETGDKAAAAVIPTAKKKIKNTLWDIEYAVTSLPENIVDSGRTAVATLLAGKASDYLVNDILSKTDTKEVVSGDWVYRSTDKGLTRMTKEERRQRERLGDDLYERLYK